MPVLTRRRFLLGAAGAFGAAALGDAFGVEPTAIDVTRHDLPVPQLPPALAGVRIACVTDVHLSRGVPPSARALVARLAVERPDIVLLAGDICNRRDDLATLASWVRDARGSAAPPPPLLPRPPPGRQPRLPFSAPYVPYGRGRFVAGWYKDAVAPLYVARGVGTVGIHARLFCPPELPVFTLSARATAV